MKLLLPLLLSLLILPACVSGPKSGTDTATVRVALPSLPYNDAEPPLSTNFPPVPSPSPWSAAQRSTPTLNSTAYDAAPFLFWDSKTSTLSWTYAAALPDGFRVRAVSRAATNGWFTGPVSTLKMTLSNAFWTFDVTPRHGNIYGRTSEPLRVLIGPLVVVPQAAPSPAGPWTEGPPVLWPDLSATNTFFRLELRTKP